MENLLKNKKRLHFIGIGGSGMYPLAQIMHQKGYILTGSDNNKTDTVDAVRKMGINVYMGHSRKNIADSQPEAIVRSAAIKDDNPEIIAADDLDIPIIERAELLGYITRQYPNAVCVAGTHGKTTVSSMLTYILMSSNDPKISDISAVIGGKLKILDGGSGRVGSNKLLVCEACEYADTFLKLRPNISVILNINHDHFDYFENIDNLKRSFVKFCNYTTDYLIYNGDDENTEYSVQCSVFSGEKRSFGWKHSNDYYPIVLGEGKFELYGNKSGNAFTRNKPEFLAKIKLKIPGRHNILNATAACAAALAAGADIETVVKGLESFPGASRRFETVYSRNGITVVDDYAHHPTEITATLKAARDMKFGRIWAVHQPFTYSRTKMLLEDFAKALSLADEVVVTEIMGGRETDSGDIHAKHLVKMVDNCSYFASFDEASDFIVENVRTDDLIITLGCGDVNKLSLMISKKLRKISKNCKNNK